MTESAPQNESPRPADDDGLLEQAACILKLSVRQVRGAMRLLDEGNTVPFITRYRQEATGGLDEEQLRSVQRCVTALRDLEDRRVKTLAALKEQGKLTPELEAAIASADSLKRLDEIYAPYRSKRKTRADEARELGLEPLARAIWSGRCGDKDLERVAASCIGKHPQLTSIEIVLAGARDLLAAQLAQDILLRDLVRSTAWKTGRLTARINASSPDAATFQDYAQFEQRLSKVPPHRILAIDRGEERKALRVRVNWDQELAQTRALAALRLGNHPAGRFLQTCLGEALERLVNPAIEREIRRELTDRAQRHAVDVFSRNLRQLLMQPPLMGRRVLAIDPGFRTGCKVAVLTAHGDLLEHGVLQLTQSGDVAAERGRLAELAQRHAVEVIAIGNGTASREAQEQVSLAIQEHDLSCRYAVVNEAGASIYSASTVGREEFPDLDATVRGTISIGRRLQDPLSELVKIEPQHIGVGMYQHDLPEKELSGSLADVVESCVNHVGVELNQASVELLKHVSGLNRGTAQAIVEHRRAHGPFRSRSELLNVPRIGAATFQQAAGFLRIRDGVEPLDATWVHPESYSLARELIARFAIPSDALRTGKLTAADLDPARHAPPEQLIQELSVDRYTLQQVLDALLRPGRDPRADLPAPAFRTGILTLADISAGMELDGVITNVVDFGAFVDVGLKHDGLVHISRMSTEFVSSPLDVVSVGQPVRVWVESIDLARERVGLTLLPPGSPSPLR